MDIQAKLNRMDEDINYYRACARDTNHPVIKEAMERVAAKIRGERVELEYRLECARLESGKPGA